METRLDVSRQRFVRETAARFFLRFHMSLIFAGAAAGGVLASRWLFVSGVDALAERYALAVVGAYFVFFVLVRGWIFYATRLAPPDPGLDAPGVAVSSLRIGAGSSRGREVFFRRKVGRKLGRGQRGQQCDHCRA